MSRLSDFPSRDCTLTQYAYPDAISALHGMVAVLAALDHRSREGGGQSIDLSQREATVAGIGHAMMEHFALGQDNDYVFETLLDMSGEEIERAVEAGAIESDGEF
ncbi:MAG: hypothetical protein GY723_23075 [bacterium]|nr:hypothetical protein [bacterium]MCP5069318.1 hypothetical protein [bacterium]